MIVFWDAAAWVAILVTAVLVGGMVWAAIEAEMRR